METSGVQENPCIQATDIVGNLITVIHLMLTDGDHRR